MENGALYIRDGLVTEKREMSTENSCGVLIEDDEDVNVKYTYDSQKRKKQFYYVIRVSLFLISFSIR